MKALSRILTVSALALLLSGGAAFAQDHPNDHPNVHANYQHNDQHQHYVKHNEWKKGSHIKTEDWNRGEAINWRMHHLRQPPHGYEWRQVDGNYVLANPGGVIFSVTVAR